MAARVEVVGAGEPVLVIQTALTADELLPLARGIAAHRFEVHHLHRDGYDGSGSRGRGSVPGDAADAAAYLRSLDRGPVHVVGASYSAAVALALAAAEPALVRRLAVVEAPPTGTAGAAEFRAAGRDLQRAARADGAAALEVFMTGLVGPDWRERQERDLPGSVAVMERDAATFFGSDVPALSEWRLTDADAARVAAPTLYVGGADTHPWFVEMRDRLAALLPLVEVAVVADGDHQVAADRPGEVAALVAGHLRAM
ncbi:alpha/beta hydrolase [Nocardioides sp. YIM 152588]|uniref:alpha/beta fold hydrolase n=1 Tax=Nocardioides sp. YIM 152588 TaxID=3158259 RepID=UPI0032E37D8B